MLTNTKMPGTDVTEAEFLEALDRVAPMLAKKVRLPMDKDDLYQFFAMHALEALPRFDRKKRGLTNFLYIHCRNRAVNEYRNRCHRADSPCKICAGPDSSCLGGGEKCKKFLEWTERNRRKYDLAFGHQEGENQLHPSVEPGQQELEAKELLGIVDEHLPVKLRADFLRMRANVQVDMATRKKVAAAVLEILRYSGIEPEDLNWTPERPQYQLGTKSPSAGKARGGELVTKKPVELGGNDVEVISKEGDKRGKEE